jgi:hypothetical protein
VRKEEKNMSMRRKESSERETRYRSMVIGHQRRGLDMAALAISTSRVPELRNARLANDEPLVLEDDLQLKGAIEEQSARSAKHPRGRWIFWEKSFHIFRSPAPAVGRCSR